MIKSYEGITPAIGANVFIAETAVVIGDVVIGDDANVWYNAVIRGDEHSIRIGRRTNVQDGAVIHVTLDRFRTVIGDNVTIAHNAVIHGATLEDSCLIGMGAIVLDDAVVESGALVAAGAVVPPGKRVTGGRMWAGCPARDMRPLSDDEKRMFDEIPEIYCDQAARYLRAP
jgi:carbonic anhydrase/acetyltransferase-like protein (isoleucine patch superfamily)